MVTMYASTARTRRQSTALRWHGFSEDEALQLRSWFRVEAGARRGRLHGRGRHRWSWPRHVDVVATLVVQPHGEDMTA